MVPSVSTCGGLDGRVYASNLRTFPLASVRVQLFDPGSGSEVGTATTDDGGAFCIDVAPAEYRIRVTLDDDTNDRFRVVTESNPPTADVAFSDANPAAVEPVFIETELLPEDIERSQINPQEIFVGTEIGAVFLDDVDRPVDANVALADAGRAAHVYFRSHQFLTWADAALDLPLADSPVDVLVNNRRFVGGDPGSKTFYDDVLHRSHLAADRVSDTAPNPSPTASPTGAEW